MTLYFVGFNMQTILSQVFTWLYWQKRNSMKKLLKSILKVSSSTHVSWIAYWIQGFVPNFCRFNFKFDTVIWQHINVHANVLSLRSYYNVTLSIYRYEILCLVNSNIFINFGHLFYYFKGNQELWKQASCIYCLQTTLCTWQNCCWYI